MRFAILHQGILNIADGHRFRLHWFDTNNYFALGLVETYKCILVKTVVTATPTVVKVEIVVAGIAIAH